MSELQMITLDGAEDWREYDFGGRVYRIERPVSVVFKPGGTMHRVTGADGITHILPAPGVYDCVVRFQGRVIA